MGNFGNDCGRDDEGALRVLCIGLLRDFSDC
jgi:hypothetical protein